MPKRDQQHPAKGATGHNNPKKTTEHSREHSELEVTHKANSREREEEREQRSGSDSNAHKHRKDSQVHEHEKNRANEDPAYDFSKDLEPHNLAGEDHGLRDPSIVDYTRNADAIKSLHTTLADLSDDELSNLNPVTEGSRLEQGATYIDLKHLEQGEFTAVASMTATPDHLYVAKKNTDYILWNRLNQVDNPRRVDENAPPATS